MPERMIPESEQLPEMKALHVARYEFARKFVVGKNAADIACGAGYGSKILKAGNAKRVTGIDISAEAIAYARDNHAAPGVEFVQGSVEVLPHVGPFDVIVSFETIEHIREYDHFLRGIAGSLTREGILIISTPLRIRGSLEDPPANPFHVQEWNAEEFDALLNLYFAERESLWQFVFAKRWYPGSRTIHRALARRLHPAAAMEFERFAVRLAPPAMPGIPVAHGYAVVVCRKPIVGH
jgi:SAM-dependent methyltransferase